MLEAQDRLARHLANRQILLLLDNFEQVVDAAPCLAELLVARLPGLKLLVTSRESLRLSGEREYAVPSLPQTEAIALFMDRACAIKADFVPDGCVAEICRRLDGLPLAAPASRSGTGGRWSAPAQSLERLGRRLELLTAGGRVLPARQRTMRAHDRLELPAPRSRGTVTFRAPGSVFRRLYAERSSGGL